MTQKKSILLAGNWKMNHGQKATDTFLSSIQIDSKESATLRLYVPFLSLETGIRVAREKKIPIEIGAQNLHHERSGAYTGEVSGPMLAEIGIRQVLVGHSERRQYFGETNETVLLKTRNALDQGFEVLLCIGEHLSERESGQTETVLKEQLARILEDSNCMAAFGSKLHLAYEPVWAIGTGIVATPEQAQSTHAFIRSLLIKGIGEEKALRTRVLYGGSVTPANFKELLQCPDIDGGLVGGASLKPESLQSLWNLI